MDAHDKIQLKRRREILLLHKLLVSVLLHKLLISVQNYEMHNVSEEYIVFLFIVSSHRF